MFHCVHFECPAQDVESNHSPVRAVKKNSTNSLNQSPTCSQQQTDAETDVQDAESQAREDE